MTDPGPIPTWQEGVDTLLANLPALLAQDAHLTINDARVIQHLAGLLPPEGIKSIPLKRSPDLGFLDRDS